MLVLTRKRNEQIVIGGNIIITIVDLRADKVRLGISAPPEVTVNRREVQDRIDREAYRERIANANRLINRKGD